MHGTCQAGERVNHLRSVRNDRSTGQPRFLVIPAAGLGTRMRVVNTRRPKELLPIGGKPALQYALEEGHAAGIRNIVIILSKKKEVLRRYVEDRTWRQKHYPRAFEDMERVTEECDFSFFYQSQPRGEADAISYAEHVVNENPFALMYPDNIYAPAPGALKALKGAYIKEKKDILALMTVSRDNMEGIGNSGRVDVEKIDAGLFRILKFYPKSEGFFVPRWTREIRTCGIMITGPHIFRYIERLKPAVTEGEFTDFPVKTRILAEREMLGLLLPGTVFDVGNPQGYLRCRSLLSTTGVRREERPVKSRKGEVR